MLHLSRNNQCFLNLHIECRYSCSSGVGNFEPGDEMWACSHYQPCTVSPLIAFGWLECIFLKCIFIPQNAVAVLQKQSLLPPPRTCSIMPCVCWDEEIYGGGSGIETSAFCVAYNTKRRVTSISPATFPSNPANHGPVAPGMLLTRECGPWGWKGFNTLPWLW